MQMVKAGDAVGKIRTFLKEVSVEFKKVVWPDKKFIFSATIIVLVIVFASAFYVMLIDLGFEKLFKFMSLLFKGSV